MRPRLSSTKGSNKEVDSDADDSEAERKTPAPKKVPRRVASAAAAGEDDDADDEEKDDDATPKKLKRKRQPLTIEQLKKRYATFDKKDEDLLHQLIEASNKPDDWDEFDVDEKKKWRDQRKLVRIRNERLQKEYERRKNGREKERSRRESKRVELLEGGEKRKGGEDGESDEEQERVKRVDNLAKKAAAVVKKAAVVVPLPGAVAGPSGHRNIAARETMRYWVCLTCTVRVSFVSFYSFSLATINSLTLLSASQNERIEPICLTCDAGGQADATEWTNELPV